MIKETAQQVGSPLESMQPMHTFSCANRSLARGNRGVCDQQLQ